MSSKHDADAPTAIKVIDRRRFNASGTVRADAGPLTDTTPARFAAPPAAPAQRGGSQPAPKPERPPAQRPPAPPAAASAPTPPEPAYEAGPGAQATRPEHGAAFADDSGEPRLEFLPFVASLATNALAAMGALPENQRGGIPRSPQMAREYIDIIVMLEQRTRGNLTPDEAETMTQLVADLRMQYVEATRSVQPVR